MSPGVRIAGHPVLVVTVFALLVAGLILDVVHQVTGDATLSRAGFWSMGVGLAGGLVIIVNGLVRWSALLADPRVTSPRRQRGALNGVVLGAFAISWLLRTAQPDHAADTVLVVLEMFALTYAAVSAGRGGLVKRHVVVDPDDHATCEDRGNG